MSLRKKNKISAEFSMASLTDMIFLLLIFFMLTSTLVSPNALKLLLPKSDSQTSSSPILTVSITKDLQYYVGTDQVTIENMPFILREKLKNEKDPTISLHCDRTLPLEEVVKVMNIAKDNKYKLILATQPN